TSAPLAPSAARSRHAAHRDLPSFPTRRSSDLRELTLAELDDAVGGRPAFIQAQYDHAAVNTGWLDATGVPPGASARAAGRVGGGLVALNRAAAAFPAGDDPEAGISAAMAWYHSFGLSPVFDPGGVGVSAASYTRIAALAARGELTLRVFTTLGDSLGGATPAAAHAFARRVRAGRPFQGDHWHDRIAVGEI